jgi:hypothetical protein
MNKLELTNMVLAIMVAVEMDRRQLTSKHVVVIKQVVAINNRNSSACTTSFTIVSILLTDLLNDFCPNFTVKKSGLLRTK